MILSPQQILESQFGLRKFRTGQKKIIDKILQSESCLAIFPTGGGKSLCYQLPAVMLPGLTVVVSPLLALMREQVDSLQAGGVAAFRIDSSQSPAEYTIASQAIKNNRAKILYVSPERLLNNRFNTLLRQVEISLLAIDEVHCISQWGHNFRPDYLRLAEVTKRLRVRCILGLTATATKAVAADIRKIFDLKASNVVRNKFNRKNLALRFALTSNQNRNLCLVNFLREQRGASIVYTTLQKTAEEVAQMLIENKIKATFYHAGLSSDQRREIQDEFMLSKRGVIVATIAFGMGVDKANIRSVVHYNCSNGLENYAQEIGRAGRDGKAAVCQTFLQAGDRSVLENFAFGDMPSSESIVAFVKFISQQNSQFYLSIYHIAFEFDIRESVVNTLLAYCEKLGFLHQIGMRYDSYQYKPIISHLSIVDKYSQVKRQLVSDLLKMTVRKKVWTDINITIVAQRLQCERETIADLLEEFAAEGWIELKPAKLMVGYAIAKNIVKPKLLSNKLESLLESQVTYSLERIDRLYKLATSTTCQARELASYFGDTLRTDCGKCSVCLGQSIPVENLASDQRIGSSVLSILKPIMLKYPEVVGDSRAAARFLCGISSPKSTRKRLSQQPAYGCCKMLRFPDVLRGLQDAGIG